MLKRNMSTVSGTLLPTLRLSRGRWRNGKRMSMPWSEIFVVVAIWLMVKGWRRSRRSDRAALKSRRSSRSSQRIAPKQTLAADADPSRVAHNGVCEHCGVEGVVPLARTRLERRPWRLVWWCSVCGKQARVMCPPELVPQFLEWDRAGGLALSMREVAEMVQVSLEDIERAIEDELL